jgi:hypothetical protein
MAFQSGHKKVGGRTKGTLNKATVQARELARDLLGPRYLARLRERLLAGEAGGMESLLWQYAFGRPGTEPSANDRADAAEFFETLLTRLEQPQSPADQQAPRRAQVTELRGSSATSSNPA